MSTTLDLISQAQLTAQIGAPNGIAPLDSQGAVPPQYLAPTGNPDGTKFLRDDNSWQPVGGGSLTLTALVRDLGTARRSGTFDITGLSGLTADKAVLITQTTAPIASKGNARDEIEFDAIQATGYVVNATTIRVLWHAPGVVVGDYAFAYVVSG